MPADSKKNSPTQRAVKVLDRISAGREPGQSRFQKVFRTISDPVPMYLALVLHDAGKKHRRLVPPEGAPAARSARSQLESSSERAAAVDFLVRHSLLMPALSQRRDLSDPALIEDFARTVQTLDRLNMLVLFTYAQASSAGLGDWNSWKAELLWELYSLARSHLEGKPARWDQHRTDLVKQRIIRHLLSEHLPVSAQHRFAFRRSEWWVGIFAEFLPVEVERHFAMLPERYLRSTEPDQITQQLRLIRQLSDRPLATSWENLGDGHTTRLTVCTRDSTGLFARLAGVLTSHAINILSAVLYTREDGVVVDVFKLCEIDGQQPVALEHRSRVDLTLSDAVEGKLDVAGVVNRWLSRTTGPRQRPYWKPTFPSVNFDSEVSATSTVIEVHAEDEPGVAYKIAHTLSEMGLNINFAKISTENSQVLDVLYATSESGKKLTRAEMTAVEQRLVEALAPSRGALTKAASARQQ